MKIKTADFHFDLPKNLIAQKPLPEREASRMLVFKKGDKRLIHDQFYNIGNYLKEGDIIVVNDSRVLPFRLAGFKNNTQGQVKLTLIKHKENSVWSVLSNKKVQDGCELVFKEGLKARILGRDEQGQLNVAFNEKDKFDLLKKLEKVGQMPLPPYIKRLDSCFDALDKERYQTIYAKEKGAVAAPTAGFHFSLTVIEALKQKGIEIIPLTLHVGLGTFLPIKAEYINNHVMHAEYYELKSQAVQKINKARERKSRILCVGTTTVRVLETVVDKRGRLKPRSGHTDIYIYPTYRFKVVSNLLTNFHLPDSTLILLVAALIGKGNLKKIYRTAVRENYRFFSYGDCMLVLD